MRRRIAITGLGIVCSAGKDLISFYDSLYDGRSAFSIVPHEELRHLGRRFAGLIPDFTIDNLTNTPQLLNTDRFAQLAWYAAQQAIKASTISITPKKSRVALILATCSGPMLSIENHYKKFRENHVLDVNDSVSTEYFSASRIVAEQCGIGGPVLTITTACSASTAAAGIGADLIRAGIVDIALVGGTDSFSPTTFAGFAGLKALCESECAPFSKPIGLNLGEGAGIMILEELEHAKNRGALITAEFLGYGLSNDAYHCSAPDPNGRGASLAMERSIQDAGVDRSVISYVNAHGTGTEANDKAESKAIKKTFGDHADRLAVSSTKSMVGHCLGASGAVEMIATLACGVKGILPPNVHFSGAREGCTLDYVEGPQRRWIGSPVFINNNFAFGGNNASAVITLSPEQSIENPKTITNEKIYITGIGVLSAAGVGLEKLDNAFRNQIKAFTNIEVDKKAIEIARVPDYDIRSVDRKIDSRSDRASLHAASAVSLALQSASIPARPSQRSNLGFYLCLSSGSTWAESDHINALLNGNFQISQVASFPYIVPNAIAGSVCRSLALTGHNTVFCDGPGSGLSGLIASIAALKNGHVNQCVTGTIDFVTDQKIKEYAAVSDKHKVILPEAEASVMFVLETESSALSRSTNKLAEIAGFALASNHCANESSEVMTRIINDAIAQAGITSQQIKVICYRTENETENEAITNVFGERSLDIIDVSGVVGNAEASLPLLNSALAITYNFGKNDSENYILTFFGSFHGNYCALVLKQHLVPKE